MATKPPGKAKLLKLFAGYNFETEAAATAFRLWLLENPKLIDWLGSLSRDELARECVLANFLLSESGTKHHAQMVRMNKRLDAFSIRFHAAADAIQPKIATHEKQSTNLAKGRSIGVKKRVSKAKENEANLLKALNDLFDKPDKPGWRWSNKAVLSCLADNFPNYKRSTIEQKLKGPIARIRSAGNVTGQ